MRPGEIFVLNDPYRGGTHLPDITVVTPVFLAESCAGAPDFCVASRGHRADIGGITLHRPRRHPDRQLQVGRSVRRVITALHDGQFTLPLDNNFTFGDAAHQYYETISGGSGAGPGFDGTSVVQTHMANSRLTDPEVLEWRLPVRLESYAIRPGAVGENLVERADGCVENWLARPCSALSRFLRRIGTCINSGCIHAIGQTGTPLLDGQFREVAARVAAQRTAARRGRVDTKADAARQVLRLVRHCLAELACTPALLEAGNMVSTHRATVAFHGYALIDDLARQISGAVTLAALPAGHRV